MNIVDFIKQAVINVECEPTNTGELNELIALEDVSDEDGISFYIACKDTNENIAFFRIFFVSKEYAEIYTQGRPYELIQYDCVEHPVCRLYQKYGFTLSDTDVEKLTSEIAKII